MAIAMTVGATKIQILQEKAAASLRMPESLEAKAGSPGEAIESQEACVV